MRSRTERPSASEMSVTFNRFGRNRRLVLIFEWLTLCPTCAPLPVSSHRRDMAKTFRRSATHSALAEWIDLISGDGGPIVAGRARVKRLRRPPRRPGLGSRGFVSRTWEPDLGHG